MPGATRALTPLPIARRAAATTISRLPPKYVYTAPAERPDAARMSAIGLPVAIAGPAEQVEAATAAIEEQADGALDLVTVDSRDAAVAAIESREVYGAIVLGQVPEVLTTSGSPVVAQLLGGVAQQLQTQASAAAAAMGSPAPTVAVTDVVPLLDADPRGAGIAAAGFPLVLGGMLGGIAVTLLVTGAWRRVLVLLVYGAAAGLAIAGVMLGWFGVVEGDLWQIAGVFSLSVLAIGAPITGFASLVGRSGIALGPIVFLLFANPISGAASPKEFRPGAPSARGSRPALARRCCATSPTSPRPTSGSRCSCWAHGRSAGCCSPSPGISAASASCASLRPRSPRRSSRSLPDRPPLSVTARAGGIRPHPHDAKEHGCRCRVRTSRARPDGRARRPRRTRRRTGRRPARCATPGCR